MVLILWKQQNPVETTKFLTKDSKQQSAATQILEFNEEKKLLGITSSLLTQWKRTEIDSKEWYY